MARFCTKCGHVLKDDTKFCPGCGILVRPEAMVQKVSRKQSVIIHKKLMIGVIILIVFLGGAYVSRTPDAVRESEEVPTESNTVLATKADENKAMPKKQSSLDLAQTEVAKYGFKGKIVATSYGHSEAGFLIVEGDKKSRIILVDRKNNRAAVVNLQMSIAQFEKQKNEKVPKPMIADYVIENDARDNDAENGFWESNRHTISIYAQYQFDANGNVVPGMLNSAPGRKPAHYHGVLYEPKNVDMANLFLTEALPLLKNAKANNVSI